MDQELQEMLKGFLQGASIAAIILLPIMLLGIWAALHK